MEEILVISTYPPKGSLYGNKFSAVASYTKNTLTHMSKSVIFTVFADESAGFETYGEKNIAVEKCWKRNDLRSFLHILKAIKKRTNSKKLLFAFEFGMFGSRKLLLGLIPLLLLLIKAMGKKIYIVSHGVILNFSDVSKQVGIGEEGKFLLKVMGLILKTYYFILGLLSTKIIVFEEHLRLSLISIGVDGNKIHIIPHGVCEEPVPPSKGGARKKLGFDKNDFVILCFGFLIWYKGSDFIVKAFKNKFKNGGIKLVMAGGGGNIHKNEPLYTRYISSLYKNAEDAPNIKITGFLNEKDIKYYFSACDLVVLPYRAFISASGPLSFALTYKKPFVVSRSLSGYAETEDFKKALKVSDLNIMDISFPLEEEGFYEKISALKRDKKLLGKALKLSRELFISRNWQKIGELYNEVLL